MRLYKLAIYVMLYIIWNCPNLTNGIMTRLRVVSICGDCIGKTVQTQLLVFCVFETLGEVS